MADNKKTVTELEQKVARQATALESYKEEFLKLKYSSIERDLYKNLVKVFAGAATFDSVFKGALDIISGHLKARYYGIFWLNNTGDGFEFRHGKGYRKEIFPLLPRYGSLMGECLNRYKTIWEESLREGITFIGLKQQPEEYNVLCAPVKMMGKAVGVIRIANLDPDSAPLGLEALATVAPLLSSTLERLLYLERSERNMKGLDASYTIARLLENTLNEDDIMRQVCAEIPKLFSCSACMVAQVGTQQNLVPFATWPGEFFLGGNPQSGIIYLRNLLQAFPGCAALISDIHGDKRWSWPSTAFGSLCIAPLKKRGQLKGAVIALGPLGEEFTSVQQHLLGLVAMQTSLTLERAEYFRQQEELARRDGLTGLLSHRVFQDRIREEIPRCRRYKRPLSLIMLDIDNFKSVNDSFGHPVGDQVIKMIAGQLLRIARSSDRIFRYGGEEFCILLPETTGPNAAILAERLRMEIAKDRTFQFPITVSMGISTLQDGDTPEQLIVRADDALYQAKRLGRNRVEIQK